MCPLGSCTVVCNNFAPKVTNANKHLKFTKLLINIIFYVVIKHHHLSSQHAISRSRSGDGSGGGQQEEEGSSLDSDIEEQEAATDYVKGRRRNLRLNRRYLQ